jgi:hypothetical protein
MVTPGGAAAGVATPGSAAAVGAGSPIVGGVADGDSERTGCPGSGVVGGRGAVVSSSTTATSPAMAALDPVVCSTIRTPQFEQK